jgi:hypothetical protein
MKINLSPNHVSACDEKQAKSSARMMSARRLIQAFEDQRAFGEREMIAIASPSDEVIAASEAAEANAAHEEFNGHIRNALICAKRAGDALNAAKAKVGFGKWQRWVHDNFNSSIETARIYMKIATNWDSKIKDEVLKNPEFTIDDARRLLKRAPSENGVTTSEHQPDYIVLKQHVLAEFRKCLESLPIEAYQPLYKIFPDFWSIVTERLSVLLGVTEEDVKRATDGAG